MALRRTLIAFIGLAAAGCSTTITKPERFAQIAAASQEECEITRTALLGILQERPYFAKAAPPPWIKLISVSPALIPLPPLAGPHPYASSQGQPPMDLSACLGARLSAAGHVAKFEYPLRPRTMLVIDPEGWISRPIRTGAEEATVYVWRGQCYGTSEVKLEHAGAWRVKSIRHGAENEPGVEMIWTGNPCSPWP